MIEPADDLGANQVAEFFEVVYVARLGVHFAGKFYNKFVIVAVVIGAVAQTENLFILLIGLAGLILYLAKRAGSSVDEPGAT